MKAAKIAICGAGIAGIASAYYLAVKYQQPGIVLIDRDQPMSFTTSKSGENYRDYWPDACMSSFIGHSIDLMRELAEQSGDRFDMREFDYDFVSQHADNELFSSDHLIGGYRGCRPIRLRHHGGLRCRRAMRQLDDERGLARVRRQFSLGSLQRS